MATFTREVGIIFGTQSSEGTADATIAADSGTIPLADGAILGDTASGIAESGITHSFTRRLRDKGAVSASFTELASDFLEEEVSLSFAFPMAGSRQTSSNPVVDADLTHDQGINDLLAACGLAGNADGGGVGWIYTPADVSIATAKLFDSGVAWVIRDIRGDWSLTQVPGEIGIMTCTLSGIVDSFSTVSFPTLQYSVQATITAPNVSSVSPVWGSIARGWTDLTISCTNEIEKVPDSASSTGSGFEQTGRVITVDMNIRDDSTDRDFTRAALVKSSAPTDDLTATVGTATGTDSAALAYQIACNNIDVRSYTPDVAGKKAASNISGVCTGLTDGTEFSLTFI